MISALVEYYTTFVEGLKTYPQLQTAFLTLMGGAVMGALGFALIRAPRSIATFFRNQFLTTLVFNTASASWSEYNQMQYVAFIKWFAKNRWFGWSRTITFDSDGRKDGNGIGPGLGRHFFFYGLRLFIFNISEMDSQGTNTQKYKITLSCVGRSKKPIYKVMDEFMVKHNFNDQISVYRSNGNEWQWVTYANKRDIKTVIMSDALEEQLVGQITEFLENEKWYRDRGLNYKKTILLYGPPGTGKSSLIRAIASYINRDLYIYDVADTGDMLTMLQNAKKGVVVIEDIDGFSAARSRTNKKTEVEEAPRSGRRGAVEPIKFDGKGEQIAPASPGKNLEDMLAEWGGMNISGLLNALDGVVGLDDVIIFMTTNHPEKLDPALIRDGRVDSRVEVGYLGHPEICKYIRLFFPDASIPKGYTFGELPGCTVQKLFMQHRHSHTSFMVALLEASGGYNDGERFIQPRVELTHANV